MIRPLIASLIAGTTLVAPSVQAQDTETTVLRAQIEELQAQIRAMSARLDQMDTETVSTQTSATMNSLAPAVPTPSPANTSAPTIAFAGAPEFEAPGGLSFKLFGRLNIDAGTAQFPAALGRNDGFGSEMRRARIGVEGDLPGGFGYKVEVDFAGSSAVLTDTFITYQDDGLTLTLGQHNNFQSLEELASSRWSTTIERAAFTDAFNFDRRVGFSAEYKAGDLMLQGGVFTDTATNLPGKTWRLDGRAVYAPKIGDTRLHLGGSLHLANLESGETVRYRQRPLVHFTAERPLATPTLNAASETGLGLEAAVISGRLHAAAETHWQHVNGLVAAPDYTFFGGYAEIGYYLTRGDTRGYRDGRWNRTRPASPVDEGGVGAWQVNLRYDYLDLNDGAVLGGKQDGYIASLIWVPTDFTRLTVNYGHLVYADAAFALPSSSRAWNADVFGMRGQIDF